MKIIDGKKYADQILNKLSQEIEQMNFSPCLAVVFLGKDDASRIYVNIKEKKADEIGLTFRRLAIPESSSQDEVISLIESLNNDKRVQGIIIQLPLPAKYKADDILKTIALEKDIDGLRPQSGFESPFVLAIYHALISTDQDLAKKKILALVNSEAFGQKLKDFFNKHDLALDYSLSQIKEQTQQVDVLITVLGQPKIIKADWLKPGAIVIDGGISSDDGKVVGDVDQESVKDVASYLSPVPGGVGPITVAYLLNNVVKAVKNV